MNKQATMAVARRDDEDKNNEEIDAVFSSSLDICDQLLHRYSKSTSSHHIHLCATAVAIRSILHSHSLPLTPPAYFAAAMSAVSSPALDSSSAPHLLCFLSITVSSAPPDSISPSNAADAISVLLNLSRKYDGGVFSSVLAEKALIRCLGFLLGFCDLEDWSSVRPGFETLVSYSVHRRPKIRKNAQVFLEKMFKSFQNDDVIGEASQLVLYLIQKHSVLVLEMNGSNKLGGSDLGSVAVFHTLNLLRLTIPYLSPNVRRRVFAEVSSLVNSEFSVTTRHIFNIMESCFANSITGDIYKEVDRIVVSLVSYISVGGKPEDTVVSAVTLLKHAFDALCVRESDTWIMKIPSIFGSLAALLSSDTAIAKHTSSILKVLISSCTNFKSFTKNESQLSKETEWSVELRAVKSICRVFSDMVTSSEVPSDHMLIVISHLFVSVGSASFSLMHSIVHKFSKLASSADKDVLSSDHFRCCIGSAVIAMGIKKMFTLLPISFNAEKMTFSNFWLVPIVKEFAVRSSLGYFLEHIVSLAGSVIKASPKDKNSPLKKDLRTYSDDLLGLLPAFCRNPSDLFENAEALTKYFLYSLRKSTMRETIAISIQELVKCHTNILKPSVVNVHPNSEDETLRDPNFRDVHFYSKKMARKNIRVLASISKVLLHALSELLFKLPSEKYQNVKEAIRCLASVSDPKITKGILQKYLKRVENFENSTIDDAENNKNGDCSGIEKSRMRSGIMNLASCIVVEGADKGLVEMVYNLVISTLKVSDENGRLQACNTLVQILEVQPLFCSSRYDELVDLVLSLKPGTDIPHVKSQFSALYILLIHGIEATSDEDNMKTFLVLNEIILALENHNKDVRKTAYDLLIRVSSLPECPPSPASHLQIKLITMIMGHLSGTTSQIKRGAVSALSVMLFKNNSLCVWVPDLVPSVSLLLETKSIDVVKVGLGFMKVLVLALEEKELMPFLPKIVPSVLLWSSFSRNHLKSKVSVIMEIILRKCGSPAVKSITPNRYIDFIHTILEVRQKRSRSSKSGSKKGAESEGRIKNTSSCVKQSVPGPGFKNREGHKGRSRPSGLRGAVPGTHRSYGYSGKKRKMDRPNSGTNGIKGGRFQNITGNKKQRMS